MIVDLKNPEGVDGVDFINIYSKADTLLGRRLSNWAKHDIDISLGKFKIKNPTTKDRVLISNLEQS